MGMYDNMLPKKPINGHRGYYPACSAEEWGNLPNIYKAMEWFPVETYDWKLKKKEQTIPEYVVFDVVYMMPYGIRASVKVHVQEVQSILFSLHEKKDCHLYSISHVIFANGEKWWAEWRQDSITGAFGVYASGKCVGIQGGYMGHIPSNMTLLENGEWKWDNEKGMRSGNRCHYALLNPFTHK